MSDLTPAVPFTRSMPERSAFLRIRTRSTVGDERVNALLQHRQRHRSHMQDGVVEVADIELRPQRFFGPRACFLDRHLAQVVRQGLARPRDVAIHFGLDFVPRQRRVLHQVGLRLLARPALGMHARVDDEA